MTAIAKSLKLIAVITAITFVCACNKGGWEFQTGEKVRSSPTISGRYVYIGSTDNKLYCLNAATGEKVWEFAAGDQVNSSPAVTGGYVYVGSNDRNVYCLNAATGKKFGSLQQRIL